MHVVPHLIVRPLFKGASPPPTHIFLVVARDYISETTVAISQ